ncbi:HAD-IA family hydrolase [Stella sp.]|uniref:HAD-IA family hydrolase n=1 Tax=Stella sp. TaxID=2912054 RepID=UPI0035B3F56B
MAATLPIRLVLFDCDGTLVDGRHAAVAAMAAGFAAAGLPPPAEAAVCRVGGLSLEDALRRLLPADAPDELHRRAAAGFRAAFAAQRARPDGGEPLFPGIADALVAMEAAGCLLGVATGMARRPLLALLDAHGLRRRFVTLQTADDGPGKPAPDMILRAMAETGAEPGSTAMVGDTTYDMEMARNARVAAIGVAWGHHPPPMLTRAGARCVAAAPVDLPRLASELLSGEENASRL